MQPGWSFTDETECLAYRNIWHFPTPVQSNSSVNVSQMMVPPFDSPILLGSYWKPLLTQHSEIFFSIGIETLILWAFQNLPIPDQVIMVLRPRAADRSHKS